MNLVNYDVITDSSTFTVEFTRAEEVAEYGEHAEKKIMALPSEFKLDDKNMFAIFENKVKEICINENFDTVVLQETKTLEYLYYIDKKSD